MQPVIYDVAVSMDGYIAGPDGDISLFPHGGAAVEDYFARLETYRCAIMGRTTYEFGYRFGLAPGENPYAHMETHVFSATLEFADGASVNVVAKDALAALGRLRASAEGPIYLCGGGHFAGSLLRAGVIDELRLKRAPILLGGGTRLFAGQVPACAPRFIDATEYADGYVLQRYALT